MLAVGRGYYAASSVPREGPNLGATADRLPVDRQWRHRRRFGLASQAGASLLLQADPGAVFVAHDHADGVVSARRLASSALDEAFATNGTGVRPDLSSVKRNACEA